MKPDKGALWRAIIYTVALIYLFLDLFVFYGPLKTALKGADPKSDSAIAKEIARGVAARVYFQPILLTQIDRRVQETLWERGETPDDLPPERLKAMRLAVLDGLFNEHLLRVKARHNPEDAAVTEEQLADTVADFKSRFVNPAELDAAIEAQGWKGEKELVARVGARLEQENYLGKRIGIEISEDELARYYEENRSWFVVPERVEARQIFFAALDHPGGEARRLADQALARLKQGEDFAALAGELSEDANSKNKGGSLGWFSRDRLAPDFTGPVFAQTLDTVQIIETRLGSHLVEVLAKQDEKELSIDDVREDLRVALSNRKREQGLAEYLGQLRIRERFKVEVFRTVLDRPWSL